MTDDRKKFLGSSDAKRVMEGDWFSLYQEKTGAVEPVDLTDVFIVQLGIQTEAFHIDWLNKHHGFEITPVGRRSHPEHKWLTCLIDGWDNIKAAPVELKHTNAFNDNQNLVNTYKAQIALQQAITGSNTIYMSAIMGNKEPEPFKVTIPKEYIDEVVTQCVNFWWHVENKVPPEELIADLPVLEPTILIDDMRVVDMEGNNEWASAANDYMISLEAAGINDTAKKTLKDLVEKDVREASGYGITFKRSKNGALRMSVDKSDG